MILHCKNAEMTIILSFLHFYSVKSYNFCCCFFNILIFFLNLAVFYIGENKKKSKIIYFFSKMQKFGSEVNQEIKKKSPKAVTDVTKDINRAKRVIPSCHKLIPSMF